MQCHTSSEKNDNDKCDVLETIITLINLALCWNCNLAPLKFWQRDKRLCCSPRGIYIYYFCNELYFKTWPSDPHYYQPEYDMLKGWLDQVKQVGFKNGYFKIQLHDVNLCLLFTFISCLYKYIIPVALVVNTGELELHCHVGICTIIRKFFLQLLGNFRR